MNARKRSILQLMVQLNPSQLRSFIRKTSNRNVISVICECLLNVVNGNVRVNVPNIHNFEEILKLLMKLQTKRDRKQAIILSKQGFNLVRHILYFCFNYLRR